MPRTTTHHFWRSSALPFVESRRASDSAACYAPHSHSTLSIGAVDGGESVFSRNGQRQKLVCGDVVLIPAGEVHSCNPADDGRWSYQMLYLDPEWIGGVVGEMGAFDAMVLNRLPSDVAPRRVHERLTQLNECLFSSATDEDKEAALLVFVGDLFAEGRLRRKVRTGVLDSARLRAVQALIAERCAESLSLDKLAREAGMSRYHFVRAFSRAVGMTPHAWQLDRRIERARAWLEQGMSLADAALQLGFADQSHFQRAFKQRVAATPGEYRQVAGSSS